MSVACEFCFEALCSVHFLFTGGGRGQQKKNNHDEDEEEEEESEGSPDALPPIHKNPSGRSGPKTTLHQVKNVQHESSEEDMEKGKNAKQKNQDKVSQEGIDVTMPPDNPNEPLNEDPGTIAQNYLRALQGNKDTGPGRKSQVGGGKGPIMIEKASTRPKGNKKRRRKEAAKEALFTKDQLEEKVRLALAAAMTDSRAGTKRGRKGHKKDRVQEEGSDEEEEDEDDEDDDDDDDFEEEDEDEDEDDEFVEGSSTATGSLNSKTKLMLEKQVEMQQSRAPPIVPHASYTFVLH